MTIKFWPQVYSNQSRKPNLDPCSNEPRMVRTWTMTTRFPMFNPCFQCKTNQRKSNMLPKPVMWDALLLVSLPPASSGQQSSIRAYLRPSPFCTMKLFHSLSTFESLLNTSEGGESLTIDSSEKIATDLIWKFFIYFHTSMDNKLTWNYLLGIMDLVK